MRQYVGKCKLEVVQNSKVSGWALVVNAIFALAISLPIVILLAWLTVR